MRLLIKDHKEALVISERLTLAAEAAGLGVWDWDLRTGAMTYSDRAKIIFGFKPDDCINFESMAAIVHPDDVPLVLEASARSCDPNIQAKAEFEYRIIRPDRSLRGFLSMASLPLGKSTASCRP